MTGGDGGGHDGVEVFMPDGGEILQAYAAEGQFRMRLATVDGYVMAAFHQARGEFFREGFESAVPGGYAAAARESGAHPYALAASGRLRAIFSGTCFLTG